METIDNSRVIIFGGGFNPPTVAHAEIMDSCLALPDFNEVWVMPSGDRLDKQMEVTDEDRLKMLNLVKKEVFNDNPRLIVSDFELNLPRPNQTYQTIGKLASKFANIDFWMAYGLDAYKGMPSWTNGRELQSKLNMIIFNRGESEFPIRSNIINLKVNQCDLVSSTEVRKRINNGQSIDGFVSSSVKHYIEEKKLYI